ncbi:MAG: hypothetical protein LBD44_02115, partial [Spirochaetaceae bacterium]|nr:hypothetical protein [Spirochaetaceae bacterium]
MKKLFLSEKAVSIPALCLFCLLLFTQCDVWNKPLVTTIQDKIDTLKSIKTILVTKYPFPNTFAAGDNAPYKMSAREWADKYGLEISGVDDLNGMRVLTPGTEYTVETPGNNAAGGSLTVTVKLTDANGDGGVTTEFVVGIKSGNGNSYKISQYNDANGKAIPFPSMATAGQKVTVYVYPAQGFILKENSLSYQMSPSAPNGNPATVIHNGSFDMPAYDIELKAGFEDTSGAPAMRISGGNQRYYTSLEEAVYDAGTMGVVYVLGENVFIDKEISIGGTAALTVMAQYGPPRTIRRKTAVSGTAFTGSLFNVKSGAALTLDAGNNPGFVIDGGLTAGLIASSPLVTVSGGSFTIGARVTLQNNSNSSTGGVGGTGGAVHVSGGVFSMNGGLVQKNTAASGGAVHVSGGEFSMKDGLIKENTATLGGGVYNNDIFSISGNSIVTQDNDVYLTDGKFITVSGNLRPLGGLTAKITKQVLTGSNAIALHGISQNDTTKFTVSEAGKMIAFDGNNQGKIVDITAARGYAAAKIYYPSLQEAVDAAAGTASMPDTITVLKDIDLANAISGIDGANKHIRLTVPNGASYTIKRGANVVSSLFTVKNGASLTLEGGTGGMLAIDGGAKWGSTAGPAQGAPNRGIPSLMSMVSVDGGTLTIGAGATLQNNHNSVAGLLPESPNTGGGVYVTNGAVFMKGGEIRANKGSPDNTNTGCLGGGIFLYNNSYFLMSGNAKISGNYAKWGGGVGLKNSEFVMLENAEISANTTSSSGGGAGVNLDENAVFTMKGGKIKSNKAGCGVRIHKATFRMEGGVISGNTSEFDGGGVSLTTNDPNTFKKTGGVIYGSNETDASLKNSVTAGNDGHAVWVNSGKKHNDTVPETT